MNNTNGQALLARIKPGALVTIRALAGDTLTGRYQGRDAKGRHVMATGRNTAAEVTADNLLRVTP